MFSKETEDKFKHLVSLYPRKRSALIPMLLLAQKEDGYIKPAAIDYVARYLDLNPSEVDSIMSFYTLLRRRPVGKYHIMICTNLSCLLRGSDEIEACVKRELGVNLGEVTADGLFSAIEFECLASCTTAPVIQINGEFYENLDVRKTEEILDELRKRR
ncbi:MAG: NAD(P)H-dependent oxidoreductase subunit E [Acidobacteria bacterium]|nr:MAG: NAD(P)H-dependent oxidoreductase subunit E [Acidobacteriota bacterium]PYS14696.1 MAG: NAD(P)H-dependent oxidoreductase subunit E [Acidobacteriota bacterium]